MAFAQFGLTTRVGPDGGNECHVHDVIVEVLCRDCCGDESIWLERRGVYDRHIMRHAFMGHTKESNDIGIMVRPLIG